MKKYIAGYFDGRGRCHGLEIEVRNYKEGLKEARRAAAEMPLPFPTKINYYA